MTRSSRAMVAAGAACASIALVLSSPLAAAAAEVSWDGDTNVAWDVATNWASGTVPVAGDALLFSVPGVDGYSDNNLANPFLADRLVIGGDAVNIAGWPIAIDPAGTVGIQVTGTNAIVSPELRLGGDQTVSVAAGASISFPSNIRIESGVTTFDIDGAASIGQLDGVGFAGGAQKTGSGVLTTAGAGGIAGGLSVLEGTVFTTGDGAGTAWYLADGASITGYGMLERLLAEDGRIAPGDNADGSGIDTLEIWNQFATTEQTVLDLELLANGSGDSIFTLEGTQVDGAVLALTVEDGTVAGTEWTILEQERETGPAYFWTFTTPDGDAIVEGEEFVSNGHLYTLETVDRTVVVTYVGVAPVPPTPPAPAVIAATGLDAWNTFVGMTVAGGVLLLGLALVVLRRVRRAE